MKIYFSHDSFVLARCLAQSCFMRIKQRRNEDRMKRERNGIIYRGISLLVILAVTMGIFGTAKAETALPKPVVSLSKRTKTTAKITIEKKGNVTGYQIYIKTSKNGKYQLVTGIRNSSYTFKKLKANKTYYVKVRAYRTKGIRITYGKYSKVLTVKPYKKTDNTNNKPSNGDDQTNNTDTSQYLQEVLDLVNKEREAAGLAPLALDEKLNEAAKVRAQEISLDFSPKVPPLEALEEYDCSYTTENIAKSQSTPAEVVESWMNSEGDREHILSSYPTKLGVGYCQVDSGSKHYWVLIFTD